MELTKDEVKAVEGKLDDIAAELSSIADSCDVLTACIEHDNVDNDVLYGQVYAIAKHINRISDDVSNIRLRKAVA